MEMDPLLISILSTVKLSKQRLQEMINQNKYLLMSNCLVCIQPNIYAVVEYMNSKLRPTY